MEVKFNKFTETFIDAMTNLEVNNLKDHQSADQHQNPLTHDDRKAAENAIFLLPNFSTTKAIPESSAINQCFPKCLQTKDEETKNIHSDFKDLVELEKSYSVKYIVKCKMFRFNHLVNI